jgi:hypothetical protein
MNAGDAIKLNLEMSKFVGLGYLGDLTDADLMRRPCAGCNHLNWQVGHLVLAEHDLMLQVLPGSMPDLPAGFSEKYAKETATSDDPQKFCNKAELLGAFEAQRAATLKSLDATNAADFDKATGIDYAPTLGSMFSLQGSHWMMHAGQWAVVRRQLGHPPMF